MILTNKLPASIQVAFAAKVSAIALKLNFEPDWLMATMYSESGLNPAARNPTGGATGLIQFMPATAIWLGTTTEALAKMTHLRQLDFVSMYYEKFGNHLHKVKQFSDLYLLTFYPKALIQSWADSKAFPDLVYKMNPGLDLDKNKVLTVGEFRRWAVSRVNQKLPEGVVISDEVKKKHSSEGQPLPG